jgi:hypothetical protein
MSEAIIAKLIENRVLAWGDDEDIPIAFENVAFDPPAGIYARVFHLPATTTSAFLEGRQKTFSGIYQVSVVAPQGDGAGRARDAGMSLSARFPVNLVLIDGAFSLQIVTPVTLGPAIVDSEGAKTARYTIPCGFQYRADTVS